MQDHLNNLSAWRELTETHACRKAMIDEFDLDMDGAISEQEFIKCAR